MLERPVRGATLLLIVTFVTMASPAFSQAILRPNQIVGRASLPTTNPIIAARLATPAPDAVNVFWGVLGRHSSPPRLEHSTTVATPTRSGGADFELTVESSEEGIPYELWVSSNRSNDPEADLYRFAPLSSAPVRLEPAPDVRLDVTECPGAVRFRWVDVTGAPALVTSGRVRALRAAPPNSSSPYIPQASDSVEPGSTEVVLVVRGDAQPFLLQVDYTLGADPFSDVVRYRYEATVAVGCDEVLEIVHQAGNCTGSGSCVPLELGSIAGRFDIRGEDEHRLVWSPPNTWYTKSMVRAEDGPWENERYGFLDRDPSCGDFLLPNLMISEVELQPRPYRVSALAAIRRGDRFATLETPLRNVFVGCGEDVDLGDTLVMTPAFVSGSILLAGPPPRPAPVGSPLDHLIRVQDPDWDTDADGIPDRDARGEGLNFRSFVRARSGATEGNAMATFSGAMTGDGATFAGSHELVLASPNDASSDWDVGTLRLTLRDLSEPQDPARYLSADTLIEDSRNRAITVSPGARVVQDHRYCLSRVDVGFVATSGTFYWPRVFASGGLAGADFEGNVRDYDVYGSGQGTPATRAEAASTGLVSLVLPAGEYELQPSVYAVSPGGSTSDTELLPLALSVGCRQDLTLLPDLVVEVAQVGPCADAGWIVVTGRVTGGNDIARIEWSVNGSAPTVACAPCGVDPRFSLDVPVALVPNEILVRAVSVDGRMATAVSHTQPAREPSALDLRPGVEPLRVTKASGGRLRLTWEDVPGAEADVFRGTIAGFRTASHYDHAPIDACGIAGGATEVDLPSFGAYFVVAGSCGWGNGSCGRDSRGRERSVARGTCP